MMYKSINKIPSFLPILSEKSEINKINKLVINKKGTVKKSVSFCTVIGWITAEIPIIKSILVMQLPTAFPIARSPNFFRAATTETDNSGNVVPIAMRIPISVEGIIK